MVDSIKKKEGALKSQRAFSVWPEGNKLHITVASVGVVPVPVVHVIHVHSGTVSVVPVPVVHVAHVAAGRVAGRRVAAH